MKRVRYIAILIYAGIAIYFILFFYVTVGIRIFPIVHFSHFAQGALHHNYVLSLRGRYGKILGLHDLAGLKAVFLDIDFGGNVLLFMPFPFCLYQLFGVNTFWKLLLIGVLGSITVEFTQFVFSIGVADINDVITNTLGVLVGIVLLYIGELL